ncbi:snRNA-activating protein complex subunit 4 [Pyxicephalus adspersus]|uniref:snRNA-activating protein complex subunit 4 n=1 Tax=Pyxicephalus adspersus TaxID=30357 RepID=UPI003B5CD8CC
MASLDLKARRDKIQKEIEALEKSLGSNAANIDVEVSDSDDDLEELDEDCQDDFIWEDGESSAETCLQMNLVYQAVIEEKMQELEVLIAQNKEQQEEIMWELAGRKTQRAGATKLYPLNLSVGHFMKPYFKDKVSGVGPPANPEMRVRNAHIVKTFQDLTGKACEVEYLQQKLNKATSSIEKKILTKQIHEAEREIDDINQLQEDVLLGRRTDDHDWDKIANINFEGIHTAERLCRIWQNCEHPQINKDGWSEGEIQKLKNIAKDHNFVNWEVIAQELGTNRTAFQCLQVFQRNNKDFKRSEFTKEEDEILTHFVQRMRVGEHIPYSKIAYFMEGRDSLQLLYRWTKSLDPSLKKGAWSKEEDEMLLKAVAKYGEKDWYKIRSEVPGRNDVQCRERYLKGLHKDVKKGKWSQEEKDKLVALTEKYGVGHWAQVSKELPHRTGSQCLSKWKQITGYFKKRKRRRKGKQRPLNQQKAQKPSKAIDIKKELKIEDEISTANSSSDSSFDISSTSSESEDESMEPMDHSGEAEMSYLLHSVPDLDLWIPRKKNPGLQNKTLFIYSASSDTTNSKRRKKQKIKENTFQFNTIMKGIAYPPSTDTVTETVADFLKEAEENGCEILQIQEGDIVKILTSNAKESEKKQIQRLRQRQSKTSTDSDTDQRKYNNTTLSQSAVRSLHRASVDRKLLCAVTRWVGNVLLPISTRPGRHFRKRTVGKLSNPVFIKCTCLLKSREGVQCLEGMLKGYSPAVKLSNCISKKLCCKTITSTPIFTLLVQFFQIDAEGCLKMIQLHKGDETEFSRGVKNIAKKSVQNLTSEPMSPKSILVQSFCDQKSNSANPQTEVTLPPSGKRCDSLPKVPRVKSFVPAPKLKTVSQLLKEKRMQKSKAVQNTAVLSGNALIQPQILIQQSLNPTLQPQSTSQNVSRLFSPIQACQIVTTNNVAANPMSPVSVGLVSSQVSKPTGSVPVSQLVCSQDTVQRRSSGVPTTPQPFSGQVTLLSGTVFPSPSGSALPITLLVTSQGLISVPTQALPCNNLTQASGNQSPRNIIMPLNTAATGTSVTLLSNSSVSNLPLDTLRVSAQTLPVTSSCTTQKNTVTSSTVVHCSQVSGNSLPMLAPLENSRNLSEFSPAVTGHICQDGSTLSANTSSLRHTEYMATTSSVDSSLLVAGPCLPVLAPSDALKIPSQTLPVTTCPSGKKDTELNKSQPQTTDSCSSTLTKKDASKVVCHIVPAITSSLTQSNTAAFSPVVNCQKESSSNLHATSKTSRITSHMLPVASSFKQEGTLVTSVASQPQIGGTCLPKCTLPPGLPNKACQLKLTPQKYPIVKVSKLLQTNDPKGDMVNVTNVTQYSSVSNKSNQTTSSERNKLDIKLISLEEETNVKEWLQIKQGVEVPNKKSAIAYLPPSICTLKTFSRLLLEKKTLEENAFKLLPVLGVSKVSSVQMQTTLGNIVEENLKDNLAYQLIKQRFLSLFTIPGFLAILPPTPISTKQEDSDEDIEDLMNSEINMTESTDEQNDTSADGVGNTSALTILEQEMALDGSSENPNTAHSSSRITTRRSVNCQAVA